MKNLAQTRKEAYLENQQNQTIEEQEPQTGSSSQTQVQQPALQPIQISIPTLTTAQSISIQQPPTNPLFQYKPIIMSHTTPSGHGVANFRVPRSWDNNAPKFTTDDAEDLKDFVDQVDEIISLAKISTDEEKKRLLTSYLPNKKKTMWRDLDSYDAGSYDDFLKEIFRSYPELRLETEGTLRELERLCAKYRGINLHDEGRLKRFGMEFMSLIRKLTIEPAIILNKEACQRYLDTLDSSFANILRGSISARNMLKEEFKKAQGASGTKVQTSTVGSTAATKTVVDYRKEDPIALKDLVEMAEHLAATGVTGTTWGEKEIPTSKRSSVFSVTKIDKSDERFEELSGEMAELKDTLALSRKEVQASQAEIMKAFQQYVKGPPPHMDDNRNTTNSGEHMNNGHRGVTPSLYERPARREMNNSNDRYERNRDVCFYCEGGDHFSKECPIKNGHIMKRWLLIEDRQQKLGDGSPIPRGRGSVASRVEEYWHKKSVGQNMYSNAETFYGGYEGDEIENVYDEIKTLRVRLNQITGASAQQVAQPTFAAQIQPTYMAPVQAPAPTVNIPVVQPTPSFNEFAKAMYNLMQGGEWSQDQFVTTRGGKESTNSPGQGF